MWVFRTICGYRADEKQAYEDQYEDKWEIIRMKYASASKEEQEERQEALAEVADPHYLLNRDAEGEIEVEDSGAVFS